MILLHIIRSKKRMPIDALVRRLHELQKTLPAPDKLQEVVPTLKVEEPTKLEPRVEEPVAVMKVEESAPAILETLQEIVPVVKIAEPIQVPPELKAEETIAETAPILTSEELIATSKLEEPAPLVQDLLQEVVAPEPVIVNTPEILPVKVETPIIIDIPAYTPPVNELEVIAPEPVVIKEKPKAEPMPTPALENIKPYKPQIKHETVLRFAAVELDGVFSKN